MVDGKLVEDDRQRSDAQQLRLCREMLKSTLERERKLESALRDAPESGVRVLAKLYLEEKRRREELEAKMNA